MMLNMFMRRQTILPSRFLYCIQQRNFTTPVDGEKPHNPNAIKEMKFSAFNKPDGIDREYTVKDEWKRRVTMKGERFEPKPEFTRLPWDENVRHRIDEIHNDLIYKGMSYERIDREP